MRANVLVEYTAIIEVHISKVYYVYRRWQIIISIQCMKRMKKIESKTKRKTDRKIERTTKRKTKRKTKSKTLKHISFIFLLFMVESINARENGIGSANHAIGFSGGSAIGPGITYRIYSSRVFFQGTFFTRINSRGNVTDLNMGASYGRVLSEITIVKALPPTALVFVAGINGVYSKEQFSGSVSIANADDEKSVHTGAGIALEIGNTFSPGILFSLGTTYMLSMDRVDIGWEWNLGPQINVGLLYNW